jgi:DNA polymerase/3'-5' exonuclease PolX
MSDKPRFPHAKAMALARKIVEELKPACMRIEIAGSLRRRKPDVGDIEILYIPRKTRVRDPQDLLGDVTIEVNAVDQILDAWLKAGRITKRPSEKGVTMWGESNKLAVATASGIPVDFFTANGENWFSLLVCRTGSAKMNIELASMANKNGWTWKVYAGGFISDPNTLKERYIRRAHSEREVFELAGVTYREPWER